MNGSIAARPLDLAAAPRTGLAFDITVTEGSEILPIEDPASALLPAYRASAARTAAWAPLPAIQYKLRFGNASPPRIRCVYFKNIATFEEIAHAR